MYHVIQKVNAAITKALSVVVLILFSVLVAVAFAQVVTRSLSVPLTWSEELARYIAIWLAFLGTAYALRGKSLVYVEALVNKLAGKKRRAVMIALKLFTIAFCVVILVFGLRLALRTMAQTSPALSIPMGYVYLAVPVSAVLMILYAVEQIFEDAGGEETP